MERRCGVLMPVSSLWGKYGIGGFTKEAFAFVDFLKEAGQTYWQILPLGQTGYGDSPYQSVSVFAGNPYFIDPDALIREGYLTQEDCAESVTAADSPVDYAALYRTRLPLLHKAYLQSPLAPEPAGKWSEERFDALRADFAAFVEQQAFWLPDYALFSAIKDSKRGIPFFEWEDPLRLRRTEALEAARAAFAEEIRFYEVLQFWFDRQWRALKEYANSKGIRIIGDIPIYTAYDSADTWTHPELFELNVDGYPTMVAGCPPDGFSATGQLWGNPIYRWEKHRETGYAWWIRRLAHCYRLYDIVRIDHFRGFESYYAIPYGETTALKGKWYPGPGYSLFEAVRESLGAKEIIAEDLGYVTKEVAALVEKTGFPGMKVLEFAFDSRENGDYMPYHYPRNCVVYTGTHDNHTVRGWYGEALEKDREMAQKYLGIREESEAADKFIDCALSSVADTAVIPLQDYLSLGDEARINTPSTLGNNWCWRVNSAMLTKALASLMREKAAIYGRMA